MLSHVRWCMCSAQTDAALLKGGNFKRHCKETRGYNLVHERHQMYNKCHKNMRSEGRLSNRSCFGIA